MEPREGSRKRADARITIFDVARRAGVSLGTVSYVLSGRRNVGAERRARVLEAVAELNYVPNSLAQGLRRGQSRLIGISLPNATSAYFAQLTQQLEGYAARNGFEVVQVLHHQDDELEFRRLGALLAHRLAGLLLVPSGEPSRSLDLIAKTGVATVILDRAVDGAAFDQVTIDNYGAMSELAERLIGHGHRHLILVVRYPQIVTTGQRIAAIRAAAQTRSAGADTKRDDVRVSVMELGGDQEAFTARLGEALAGDGGPTAIVASNTLVGVWTVRALRSLGLAWPVDVSLVLFDQPDWADLLQPRLAIVESPTEQMASIAWDLLNERMRSSGAAPRHVELKATLQLGPSVATAPPSDHSTA